MTRCDIVVDVCIFSVDDCCVCAGEKRPRYTHRGTTDKALEIGLGDPGQLAWSRVVSRGDIRSNEPSLYTGAAGWRLTIATGTMRLQSRCDCNHTVSSSGGQPWMTRNQM